MIKETSTECIVKRGRGRPRKNPIVTEIKPIITSTECVVKRGRGRPRKNPIVTEVKPIIDIKSKGEVIVVKRGRGRPRKNGLVVGVKHKKNEVLDKEERKERAIKKKAEGKKEWHRIEKTDMTNVTTYKFLGYCSSCFGLIGDKDVLGSNYECIVCNHKGKVGELLKERGVEERPKSKRDFLEETISIPNDLSTVVYEDIPVEVEVFTVENDDEV
jgi:hypothetical protein